MNHYTCHKKIHDPDNPITAFIQYTRQDAINYYENKKTLEDISNEGKPNMNVILK